MSVATGAHEPQHDQEGRLAVDTRYYSRTGAARYLGVCLRTLDSLAADGRVRKIALGGRILFNVLDLDQLMSEHKQ